MHSVTGKPKSNGLLAVSFMAVVSTQASGAIPGLEAEKSWDLDGYVKYMATYSIPENQANTFDHLIHNRINFEYRFSPGWRINVGVRNRALWGDALDIEQYPRLVGLDSGYFDMSKNWREDDAIMNTQIDRFYISWQQNSWNGQLGRFRVNWSMNTVWNPNDIYNAYSIYDFDYEERAGTDAVMVSKAFGFADGIDLVFAPARKPQKNSISLRYFANKLGWDYQVIAGRANQDFVLGAGFATDVYEAGFRGELSWFDPIDSQIETETAIPQKAFTERTMVGSLEADYSFGGTRSWLARAAWLYISEPQKAVSAQVYLNLPLDAKTLSFTQHTLYTDVSFDLTSLNRLTASVSYYDDGSFFAGLSNSYSLATDWQLLTVLQSFNGTGDSLFGETPAVLLYANLRYSF